MSDTVRDAIDETAAALTGRSDTPRLDAEALVAQALQCARSWLYAHADAVLNAGHRAALAALSERRSRGEPLAYITGRREFWSLPLVVTPATLVPRPETETLVEAALGAQGRPASQGAPLAAVDLGTGSGAVALALARERPAWNIAATDVSPAALAVARENARALGLEHVELLEGDWWAAVGERRFDLVVSNPPYVAEGDPALGADGVGYEPRAALAAGPDGLSAIREIAAGAVGRLRPGGRLLIEHGAMQAEAVASILAGGGLRVTACHHDLAGHPRVTEALTDL